MTENPCSCQYPAMQQAVAVPQRPKQPATEVAEIIKFIKKHFPPRESAQGHGPNVS